MMIDILLKIHLYCLIVVVQFVKIACKKNNKKNKFKCKKCCYLIDNNFIMNNFVSTTIKNSILTNIDSLFNVLEKQTTISLNKFQSKCLTFFLFFFSIIIFNSFDNYYLI